MQEAAMAWLDFALLSAIHVKVALTLVGTLAFYGAIAASNRVPHQRWALVRVRRVKRPSGG
jgi:hypothetical protein